MSTFIETVERAFGIISKWAGLVAILLLAFLSVGNVGNWVWKQLGSPVEYELLSVILMGILGIIIGVFIALYWWRVHGLRSKIKEQDQRIRRLEATGYLSREAETVVRVSQDSNVFESLKKEAENVIFGKYMDHHADWTPFGNIGRPTHYRIDLKKATLNVHDRLILGTLMAARVKQICDEEEIAMDKVRILTHQEGNVLLGSCVSELLQFPHHHYYDSGTSFKIQNIIDPPIGSGPRDNGLTFILIHDVTWGLGRSLKAVQRCLRLEKVTQVIMCVLVNRHENPDRAIEHTLGNRYNQCKFYYIFNIPREIDLERMLKEYQPRKYERIFKRNQSVES